MQTPHPFPTIDGHNDTLLRIHNIIKSGGSFDFFAHNEAGHIDLPRAKAGGMGGGFFAIYSPNPHPSEEEVEDILPEDGSQNQYHLPLPNMLDRSYALDHTLAIMADLSRLERDSDGKISVVKSTNQLQDALSNGTFAIILHIEGAEAIDQDLDTLYVFYEAGLRSIGPVWSRSTVFAHGVPFAFPASPDTGPGLTDAGKRLVQACNQLGILVDLSHINAKGFWDIAQITTAPLVATHSGVHTICPSTRNLTDKQLDAIGETNGIVGINFHCAFLRPDGYRISDTPLDVIVDHVDYVVNRIGIEHVAFGSDFDGALMPAPLKDVSGLPHLLDALRKRGYDDNALRLITHQNWMRVLKTTW